jgi:hypothetical protein
MSRLSELNIKSPQTQARPVEIGSPSNIPVTPAPAVILSKRSSLKFLYAALVLLLLIIGVSNLNVQSKIEEPIVQTSSSSFTTLSVSDEAKCRFDAASNAFLLENIQAKVGCVLRLDSREPNAVFEGSAMLKVNSYTGAMNSFEVLQCERYEESHKTCAGSCSFEKIQCSKD